MLPVAHHERGELIAELVYESDAFRHKLVDAAPFFRSELSNSLDVPIGYDHNLMLMHRSDVVGRERVRALEDDAVLRVAERTDSFFVFYEIDIFDHGTHDTTACG